MGETKNYTLTVREVLQNLQTLAGAYEKVASGTSPTGNYYFSCNAADAAASIKAAQQLILQSPVWTPVSERLPEIGERVMMCHTEWRWINIGERVRIGDYIGWEDGDGEDLHDPTHWMPLPELPHRATHNTSGDA